MNCALCVRNQTPWKKDPGRPSCLGCREQNKSCAFIKKKCKNIIKYKKGDLNFCHECDIFPCEAGGGYFYDFTRTWTLGYAPDEVLKLYEDVKSTYDILQRELAVNALFGKYQARTCELFEAKGHPTVMTNPLTEEGYVHSLGHGVGLNIHERPAAGRGTERDMLVPGSVVTVEPGLYYPDRGMGVRIEDTVYFKEDGTFEVFAPYPYDFVLPMKNK